ncbi:translocation/assembly module TamB domain-containing protein [Mangrovivirga sp. M17]|uniref:Translocation/assembly module TamB domain-containing protein n=1 Tax=Mangrovivirga halotolerans TaxID=2993936 RepID=A0ABT3RQJ7_9BACT|nr:translocation/assembly module TamB domain-containing protein [Mangrovivirga halotolerans]MCX2744064.1 translocation/assembly module TamB domain-containing protein [Mangrovivirga halotolerans]
MLEIKNTLAKIIKKFVGFILKFFAILIGLFLTISLYIQLPPVQEFLINKIESIASKQLNTEVTIDRVGLTFSPGIFIHGLKVQDQQNKKLLELSELKAGINLSSLFVRKIRGSNIEIRDLYFNIYLIDSTQTNLDFITQSQTDSTATNETNKDSGNSSWQVTGVDNVILSNINGRYEMKGMSFELDLKKLNIQNTNVQLDSMDFEVKKFLMNGLTYKMRSAFAYTDSDTTTSSVLPSFKVKDFRLEDITYNWEDSSLRQDYLVQIDLFDAKKAQVLLNKNILAANSIELLMGKSELKIFPTEGSSEEESIENQVNLNKIPFAFGYSIKVGQLDVEMPDLKLQMQENITDSLKFNPEYFHFKDWLLSVSEPVIINDTLAELSGGEISGTINKNGQLKQARIDVKADPDIVNWNISPIKWRNSVFESKGELSYSSLMQETIDLIHLNYDLDMEWELYPSDFEFFLPDSTYNSVASKINMTNPVSGNLGSNGTELMFDIDTFLIKYQSAYVAAGGIFYKEINSSEESNVKLKIFFPETMAKNYLSLSPQVKSLLSDLTVNAGLRSVAGHLSLDLTADSEYAGLSGEGYYEYFDHKKDSANFILQDLYLDLTRLDTIYPYIEDAKASIYWTSLKENDIYKGDFKLKDFKYNTCESDSLFAELFPSKDFKNLNWRFSADFNDCGSIYGKGKTNSEFSDVHIDSLQFIQLYVGAFAENIPLILYGNFNGDFSSDPYLKWDVGFDNFRISQKDSLVIYEYGDWSSNGVISDTFHNIVLESDFLAVNSESNTGFDYWNKYFLELGALSDSTFENNNLNTRISGTNISALIHPFYPAIESLDTFNIHVEVKHDSLRELDAYLPSVVTTGWEIDSLKLDLVKNEEQGLVLDFGLKEFRAGEISLENLFINSDLEDNDRLLLSIRQYEIKDSLKYKIESYVNLEQSGETIITPSDNKWILNYSEFDQNKDGEMVFSPEGFMVRDFTLSNGEQRLKANKSTERLNISFEDFDIENFLGLVTYRDSLDLLQGDLNGNVGGAINSQNQFTGDGEISLNQMKLAEISAGDLETKFDFNASEIITNINWSDAGENTLKLDADINRSNSDINYEANLETHNLTKYNDLLPSNYVKINSFDSKTSIKGQITSSGFKVDGNMDIQKADLLAPFTGTKILIDNEKLIFNQDEVNFEDFTIKDDNDNELNIAGKIDFPAGYGNPVVDLVLTADGVKLLDNKREDFKTLYGQVWTSFDLEVTGLISTPQIDGDIKFLGKTDITYELPGETLELISDEGIVKFVDEDKVEDSVVFEVKEPSVLDSIKGQLGSFSADLNISIDPKAKTSLVIDPNSGDNLTVQGETDLDLTIQNEEISLNGVYTVNSGQYNLNYYGLVKKQFKFVKGSRVIWKGDPLEGEIQFNAYNSIRTRSTNLFSTGAETVAGGGGFDELNERITYRVGISIGGIIAEPVIQFTLALPPELRGNYPTIEQKLSQLSTEEYEQERNKQVFALLVTGGFISESPSQGGGNFASSAARNSVNGILTQQLNNFGSKFVQGVDVNFDMSSYNNPQSGNTTTELDVSVSKKLFNERLEVQVGSSVGLEEGSERTTSTIGAAEFVVAYELTKEGNLKIKAFRENQFDMVDGEIQNTGIALIFVKDFDTFDQLFKAKSKTKEEEDKKRQKAIENQNKEAVIEEEKNE